jgi:hypothetical protein
MSLRDGALSTPSSSSRCSSSSRGDNERGRIRSASGFDAADERDRAGASTLLRCVGVWGARIRFSCCEAVFVDQSAQSISALEVVWCR